MHSYMHKTLANLRIVHPHPNDRSTRATPLHRTLTLASILFLPSHMSNMPFSPDRRELLRYIEHSPSPAYFFFQTTCQTCHSLQIDASYSVTSNTHPRQHTFSSKPHVKHAILSRSTRATPLHRTLTLASILFLPSHMSNMPFSPNRASETGPPQRLDAYQALSCGPLFLLSGQVGCSEIFGTGGQLQ